MVEEFEEKPSAERLAQLEGVSRNASPEDPFEASMGIYMFKREVRCCSTPVVCATEACAPEPPRCRSSVCFGLHLLTIQHTDAFPGRAFLHWLLPCSEAHKLQFGRIPPANGLDPQVAPAHKLFSRPQRPLQRRLGQRGCRWLLGGSAGAVPAQVLERLLSGDGGDVSNGSAGAHFGYDVIPRALRDNLRVVAHHHPGYWRVRAARCASKP